MIFVFLRSLRATVIPGVAVPLSLVGTFGVMYLLGYSLNNLSLMALTISTGFVVDDAIVMIENIARYIEEGEKPFEAALKGAKQIGFTIVSLTVSLVAVLIPLLFMGGIIGRLFREFAVTLVAAIVVSALLSLTLTADDVRAHPAPRARREAARARVARASERGVRLDGRASTTAGLQLGARAPATDAARRPSPPSCSPSLLAVVIPKGFFPQQDTGPARSASPRRRPTSRSPRMMRRCSARSPTWCCADPDVDTVASFIGADGTNPTLNSGRLSITLKPRGQRAADAQRDHRRD